MSKKVVRDRDVFRFKDPNGFTSDMANEIRTAVTYALADDVIQPATDIKVTVKVKRAR